MHLERSSALGAGSAAPGVLIVMSTCTTNAAAEGQFNVPLLPAAESDIPDGSTRVLFC